LLQFDSTLIQIELGGVSAQRPLAQLPRIQIEPESGRVFAAIRLNAHSD